MDFQRNPLKILDIFLALNIGFIPSVELYFVPRFDLGNNVTFFSRSKKRNLIMTELRSSPRTKDNVNIALNRSAMEYSPKNE